MQAPEIRHGGVKRKHFWFDCWDAITFELTSARKRQKASPTATTAIESDSESSNHAEEYRLLAEIELDRLAEEGFDARELIRSTRRLHRGCHTDSECSWSS